MTGIVDRFIRGFRGAAPSHDHTVRVIAIYATGWRWPAQQTRAASSRPDLLRRLAPGRRRDLRAPGPAESTRPFDLGRLNEYWPLLQDKLPRQLANVELHGDRVSLSSTKRDPFPGRIGGASLRLFALPAATVVAALWLEFHDRSFHDDPKLTVNLLEHCAYAEIEIDGGSLEEYIDHLARQHECARVPDGIDGLPPERHQIVFARESAPGASLEPLTADVVKRILYRIEPPYREGFVSYEEPWGLNREKGTLGAVTPFVSLLYGHQEDVQNNVFLTTVQAVGTEARFRQIWYQAYGLVREFREQMQEEEVGLQKRSDLEKLVDALGNLELDLSFSVETSADLGLLIPSLRIESFHKALYHVMELDTRAQTVSQMFRRLSASVGSEITAIEIRERGDEEARRLRWTVSTGALATIGVPIGFLVAFFGVNAKEVNNQFSVLDLAHYRLEYTMALVLALIPIAIWLGLFAGASWKARRRRRQLAAAGASRCASAAGRPASGRLRRLVRGCR